VEIKYFFLYVKYKAGIKLENSIKEKLIKTPLIRNTVYLGVKSETINLLSIQTFKIVIINNEIIINIKRTLIILTLFDGLKNLGLSIKSDIVIIRLVSYI